MGHALSVIDSPNVPFEEVWVGEVQGEIPGGLQHRSGFDGSGGLGGGAWATRTGDPRNCKRRVNGDYYGQSTGAVRRAGDPTAPIG